MLGGCNLSEALPWAISPLLPWVIVVLSVCLIFPLVYQGAIFWTEPKQLPCPHVLINPIRRPFAFHIFRNGSRKQQVPADTFPWSGLNSKFLCLPLVFASCSGCDCNLVGAIINRNSSAFYVIFCGMCISNRLLIIKRSLSQQIRPSLRVFVHNHGHF